MDSYAIATQAAQLLAPFLPYLAKGAKAAGKKAAEALGEQVGKAGWETAQSLWEKLRGEKRVVEAAQAAAHLPDNPAMLQALAAEIARAMEQNPDLQRALTTLIVSRVRTGDVDDEGEVTGVRVRAGGKSLDISSEVETGDVRGKVTGVDYEG